MCASKLKQLLDGQAFPTSVRECHLLQNFSWEVNQISLERFTSVLLRMLGLAQRGTPVAQAKPWTCARAIRQAACARRGVAVRASREQSSGADKVSRALRTLALAGAITIATAVTTIPGVALRADGDEVQTLPISKPSKAKAPAEGVTPIITEDADQASMDSLLSEAMSFINGVPPNSQPAHVRYCPRCKQPSPKEDCAGGGDNSKKPASENRSEDRKAILRRLERERKRLMEEQARDDRERKRRADERAAAEKVAKAEAEARAKAEEARRREEEARRKAEQVLQLLQALSESTSSVVCSVLRVHVWCRRRWKSSARRRRRGGRRRKWPAKRPRLERKQSKSGA